MLITISLQQYVTALNNDNSKKSNNSGNSDGSDRSMKIAWLAL